MNYNIRSFINDLSSCAPVPGGGGASALIGAVGVALCSMVANLTTGKKINAKFQTDIDSILLRTEASIERLLALIQKDAEVFEPLSKAYRIPQHNLDSIEILENALREASSVPMEILEEVSGVIDIIEKLSIKGSRLAVSDVGVAASACRSAMEGAAMNVFINTKLMQDKEYAQKTNKKAIDLLQGGIERCDKIYQQISKDLRCAQ